MKKGEDKEGIAIGFYKVERWLYLKGLKIIAKIVSHVLHLCFACVIPPSVEIGEGTKIAHAVGVVLHHKTIIGRNCTIYQNVTIGGGKVIVGDDVLIGANAIVLGPCSIGGGRKDWRWRICQL